MPRRRLLLLWSGSAPEGIFLDRFTTAQASLTAARTAEPGHGKWIIDNGSAFWIAAGRLRGGGVIGEATWGDESMAGTSDAGAGFARTPGRTLVAHILPEDRNSDFAIGWATGTAIADPRTDGAAIVNEDGFLAVATPSLKIPVVNDATTGYYTIRPMEYIVGVTLNDQGAVYWLSTFGADTDGSMAGPLTIPLYPDARIAYVHTGGTDDPLYPIMGFLDTVGGAQQYRDGHALDFVRVVDPADWASADALATFADRMTRDDSTTDPGNSWVEEKGAWGITSNQIYLVTADVLGHTYQEIASSSDGVFVWDVNLPTDTTWWFGTIRRTDTGDYIRIGNNGTNNTLQVAKIVNAGFDSSLFSGGGLTWVSGANRVVVVTIGNEYLFWVNGVLFGNAWQTDATSTYLTGTGIGMSALDDGTTNSPKLDAASFYPNTMTLPADLQDKVSFPLWTAGSTLVNDTFTDANGTALDAHTPDTGSLPTEHAGTWTVESNRASLVQAAGSNLVTWDAGATDVEVQVDLVMPASFGVDIVHSGLIFRYVDADNYLYARFVLDPAQPNDHEIEIGEILGGAGNIQHKVQIGVVFTTSTTHKLRVQVKGDLVRVWLDENTGTFRPRLGYVIPAGVLLSGTRFGLYQEDDDPGVVFDNFSVKGVS